MFKIIFIFSVAVLGYSGAQAQPAILQKPVAVVINDIKGKQIGVLNLTSERDGVRVGVNITDLDPGTYAVHIHEHGACSPPAFESAGGHFNPEKKKHGKVDGGSHAGDLPNITVAKNRTGSFSELVKTVTTGEGPNSLFKKDGTAIIVHAKADDYKSQPAGAAGDRIACGVIKSPDSLNK